MISYGRSTQTDMNQIVMFQILEGDEDPCLPHPLARKETYPFISCMLGKGLSDEAVPGNPVIECHVSDNDMSKAIGGARTASGSLRRMRGKDEVRQHEIRQP